MDFYENLSQGNFMPSWGGNLNMTFGYPVFIFNYILQYYIIAFFHYLGVSFITSMKLFLAFSFFASGIFMYLWAKELFKNTLAAFAASIFYLFSPYHLIVLHFRVNGEILAFVFVPILLYLFQKIFIKPTPLLICLAGLSYGLFYLAHSASAIFFLPILISYILFTLLIYKKDFVKKTALSFLSIITGIILAAYVFAAHLVLSQYTYSSLSRGGLTYTNFLSLLYSPWRMGFLFQGPKGEYAFIIGYTQLFVFFLIVYFLLKNKIKKPTKYFVLFWCSIFIILVFFITPWSAFFWNVIPLISIAQFSFRLHVFVTLCTSVLAGYLILNLRNKLLIYVLIVLTIFYTILNWGSRTMITDINDTYLKQNVPYSTLNYEAMAIMAWPKWLDANHLVETKIPKYHLQILRGNGKVKEILRSQTDHSYVLLAESPLTLVENTLYFPGWTVKVDNKETQINYLNKKYLGKIIFNVPPGIHYVDVKYDDIPEYKFSKFIAVIGYLIIFLILLIISIKRFFLKK